MSATEAPFVAGVRLGAPRSRSAGLKLPPPEPPEALADAQDLPRGGLLILIAVGGAVAVSAYRSRAVADAKIAEDLKKAGPAWESFQQNRYAELQRALAVVVNNAGIISMMTSEVDPGDGVRHAEERAGLERARRLPDRRGPEGRRLRAHGQAARLLGRPLGRPDDRRGAAGRADRGHLALGRKALQRRRRARARGGHAPRRRDRGRLPDQRRRRAQPRAALEHPGRLPRRTPRRPRSREAALAASTLQDGSAALAELGAIARRDDLVHAVLRQGKTIGPLPLEVAGETYLAYFLPIRSSTDQLVGAAVALRSREKELAPFRQIQNTQILVGLAALVVAFVLSFVLARRITGPVGRLLRGDRGGARRATSRRRTCRSSRRTRSASSPAPSGRCSRSSRRRPPSSSTSRR